MIPCLRCGEINGVLYRGLCSICAPELHEKHKLETEYWHSIFNQYQEETGRDVLEDWNQFEKWLDKI